MFEQDGAALLPAVFSHSEVVSLTGAATALSLKPQPLHVKSGPKETVIHIFAVANKLIPLLHQLYEGLSFSHTFPGIEVDDFLTIICCWLEPAIPQRGPALAHSLQIGLACLCDQTL